MIPIDRVQLNLPNAAASRPRKKSAEAAPAEPREVLTLLGKDHRGDDPPRLSDLARFAPLAHSPDPLLRRIAREGSERLAQNLPATRERLRVQPEACAARGVEGLTKGIADIVGWVGTHPRKELPVARLLKLLEQEVGQGPVSEKTLRHVAALTTAALKEKHAQKECLGLLTRWQAGGQIQLEGSPEQLARGSARVQGNRLLPRPGGPPLSPLSQGLLASKDALPKTLPADLQPLELLLDHPRLLDHALETARPVPTDFLSTCVQHGLFDSYGNNREKLVALYQKSHPEPEPMLQLLGLRHFQAEQAAVEALKQAPAELQARAASRAIEAVDSERACGHHLELLSTALDSGWKPSPTEARWMVAQLFDARYLRHRSITLDSSAFAHVSKLTTLLARSEKLHPGLFKDCQLPDCSGRLVSLRAAMVDIMRHNSEDQPAARVDPARHPEMKGYFELARPDREEARGMLADLGEHLDEKGRLKGLSWGKGQMALALLSLAAEQGDLHPDERQAVQDLVRPTLAVDVWALDQNFTTLPIALNRFRDHELEGFEQRSADLGESTRLLLVAAHRGQDEATRKQTTAMAGTIWQQLDEPTRESIFAELSKLPAPLDDLEPEAMGRVMLAVLVDPERARAGLGAALGELSTAKYARGLPGKLLLELRDREHYLALEALRSGTVPPSEQPSVVKELVTFREERLEEEDKVALQTVLQAWEAGARAGGHPVEQAPYKIFTLLAEVRGDRAWGALPLYQRLAEKIEDPEQAFRDLCARIDQGMGEEQALQETLRFYVLGSSLPNSEGATIGMVGDSLRVGGTLLRLRPRS